MDVQQAAPGWYPDSEVAGWVRWWDGRQWTERRGPFAHVQRVYGTVASAPADRYDRPDGQAEVGFGQAVRLGFRQYARFAGRASRSEYWWWFLFVVVVLAVAYVPGVIDTAHRTTRLAELCEQGSSSACAEDPSSAWFALPLAWLLAVGLPTIAAAVRRLHDTGRSGGWYFVGLVPLGWLILLILLALDPTPGPNAYGLPPAKGAPGGPKFDPPAYHF